MGIAIREWLATLRSEYLDSFVNDGGSAIKFIVSTEEDASSAKRHILEMTSQRGMPSITIESRETRIHMIQDVLFRVARNLDIADLAQKQAERIVAENGFSWPRPGQPASFEAIGRASDVDAAIVKRDLQRYMTKHLMQDRRLAQDFRVAIMRLVYGRFQARKVGEDDEQRLIIDWLRGTLHGRSGLASMGIAGPIGRHNARAILRSLSHWHRSVRGRGILLWFDLGDLGARGGPYRYTPAAALDVFEVLRQLIDGIDTLGGMLCVVSVRPGFMDESDHRYSIHAYLALKMRLWPDVRPERRDNPLAPLVELRAN